MHYYYFPYLLFASSVFGATPPSHPMITARAELNSAHLKAREVCQGGINDGGVCALYSHERGLCSSVAYSNSKPSGVLTAGFDIEQDCLCGMGFIQNVNYFADAAR
jgi:hypothetical protein